MEKTHFRYLNEKDIERPKVYLKDFFKRQTSFAKWRRKVELFLLAGLDDRFKRQGVPYAYIGQCLKKQIEIAYVIYSKMDLKDSYSVSLLVTDYTEMELLSEKKYLYNASEILCLMFRHMDLREWLDEVDHLICTSSVFRENDNIYADENSIATFHFLSHLTDALKQSLKDSNLK